MVKIPYFRTPVQNPSGNEHKWYRGRGARLSSAKAPTAVRICSVPLIIPLGGIFFYSMLTPEEKAFVEYWSVRRTEKKKSLRQFTIGLPLGVMIVLALFVNLASGWHKRAAMALQNNASLIVVILVAAIGIVVFMTVFARNHERDQNETRYQELIQKQKKSDGAAN